MACFSALGGFRISFITDNIQGAMVLLLVVICSIAVGTKVDIDPKLIEPSGLTKASLLGWKLLYILPVAVVFNFMFLSVCFPIHSLKLCLQVLI